MKIGGGIAVTGGGLAAVAAAVGLLMASCSSAGDLLGGAGGGFLGGSVAEAGAVAGADPISGSVERLEMAVERLDLWIPVAVHGVVLTERDAWRAKAGDLATDGELKDARIEALLDERDAAIADRDAAVARLNNIEAQFNKNAAEGDA
jgi:hypothetical protein